MTITDEPIPMQPFDLTLRLPDASEVEANYANHFDVALAPHHFDMLFSRWSFPREQPESEAEATITPAVMARVLIPVSEVPSMIEQLEAALESFEAVQQVNEQM